MHVNRALPWRLVPLLLAVALLGGVAVDAAAAEDPLQALSEQELLERTSPPPGASREAFVRRRAAVLRPAGAEALAHPAVGDTATYVCPSVTRRGESATAAVTVKRTRVKAVDGDFAVYEVIELTRTAEERREAYYRLETPLWWLGYGLYTLRHLYPPEELQQDEHPPRAELQLTSMPTDRALPPIGALEVERTYETRLRETVNDPYAGMSLLPEATEVRLRLLEGRHASADDVLGRTDVVAVGVTVRNPGSSSGYARELRVRYAPDARVIVRTKETFRFGDISLHSDCRLYDLNDRRESYSLAGLLQRQTLPDTRP